MLNLSFFIVYDIYDNEITRTDNKGSQNKNL